MEVTKKNFKEVLKTLPEILQSASFIAIDGEFTGLHHDVKPLPYDTPEERYDKLRQGSMDFLLMQFGVCAFKFEKENSRYLVYPFNFYVFPRPMINSRKPDRRFLCQSSSMDFLASFNFDFNKVFRDGIPYLTKLQKESIKEHVKEKHALHQQESSASQSSPGFISPPAKIQVDIPPEQKEFVEGVCKQVDDFVKNEHEHVLNLAPCNGFQRKLTFQSVKARHESGLMLASKTGEKGERYIEVTKATEEEKKLMMEKKLQADLDEVDDAAGFSQVIDLISSTGKPVIGHNMMLDVMHAIQHFSFSLPENLSEFKELVGCVFPKLIDTKVMAGTQPFKEHIPLTGLAELEKSLSNDPFTKPTFVTAPGYPSYCSTNDQSHEAGYDAFITGSCFATMANYLGSFLDPPKGCVSPTCNLIEPFHNKMCLFRVQDLPYLNLTGKDLVPPRDHVFHLTFPAEWRTHDIQHLFSVFGQVFVSWIDQTSAFVSLANREDASRVMKTIELSPDYALKTFKEYKRAVLNATPEMPMDLAQSSTSELGHHSNNKANTTPFSAPRGLKRPHDASEVRGEDSEVAELTGVGGKKHKPMDPNAPVFVSRSSVSPVEVTSSGNQQTPQQDSSDKDPPTELQKDGLKDTGDAESKDSSQKGEKQKLFEEPDTW
ncbi:poly(A)-specific ribonuclease PARN-like [Acanthaster planci]|uniref:Poly(A)-specific ribonuclease PARN n=1 Tax=Acanthaster planci TaxID=133434 RepID=A0A8B7ZA72_ACAPL|nr:poly(A)-specific ribonuclease PARN-like [Acanthaster planci]